MKVMKATKATKQDEREVHPEAVLGALPVFVRRGRHTSAFHCVK